MSQKDGNSLCAGTRLDALRQRKDALTRGFGQRWMWREFFELWQEKLEEIEVPSDLLGSAVLRLRAESTAAVEAAEHVAQTWMAIEAYPIPQPGSTTAEWDAYERSLQVARIMRDSLDAELECWLRRLEALEEQGNAVLVQAIVECCVVRPTVPTVSEDRIEAILKSEAPMLSRRRASLYERMTRLETRSAPSEASGVDRAAMGQMRDAALAMLPAIRRAELAVAHADTFVDGRADFEDAETLNGPWGAGATFQWALARLEQRLAAWERAIGNAEVRAVTWVPPGSDASPETRAAAEIIARATMGSGMGDLDKARVFYEVLLDCIECMPWQGGVPTEGGRVVTRFDESRRLILEPIKRLFIEEGRLNPLVAHAIEVAGVSHSSLPWKHEVEIRPGRVCAYNTGRQIADITTELGELAPAITEENDNSAGRIAIRRVTERGLANGEEGDDR